MYTKRGGVAACRHLQWILAIDQLNAQILVFVISLLYSSTCFEHYVLIIRRADCIIQHLVSSHSVGCRPVRRLRTGRQPADHVNF